METLFATVNTASFWESDKVCIPEAVRFIFIYFSIVLPQEIIKALLFVAQNSLISESPPSVRTPFGIPGETFTVTILCKMFISVLPDHLSALDSKFARRYARALSRNMSFSVCKRLNLSRFKCPSKPSCAEIEDLFATFEDDTVIVVEGLFGRKWELLMCEMTDDERNKEIENPTRPQEFIHCATLFKPTRKIPGFKCDLDVIYIHCTKLKEPWPLLHCWFEHPNMEHPKINTTETYMTTVYKMYAVSLSKACKLQKK